MIKYYEEIRYCWECPKCGEFTEDCEDPNGLDELQCEGCGTFYKEFEEG